MSNLPTCDRDENGAKLPNLRNNSVRRRLGTEMADLIHAMEVRSRPRNRVIPDVIRRASHRRRQWWKSAK